MIKSTKSLDALHTLRGFATLYIVLHHFALYQYYPFLFIITGQGQVAVIFFLMLSGFLAEYSNYHAKSTFSVHFLFKRFLRIYPIYMGSILITYITACIFFQKYVPFDFSNLLGHILNLQQLNRTEGYIFPTYLDNTPLWYVACVWWFYVTFFFLKIARVTNDLKIVFLLSLVGCLSFIFYPNPISHITSYLIIPWVGVEIGKLYCQKTSITIRNLARPLLFVIILASIFLINGLLNYNINVDAFSYTPFIEFRHFIAVPLLVIIYRLWKKLDFIGLKKLSFFSRFSPISYAIFLIHYPLLIRYPLFFEHDILLNTIVTIPIVLGLAYLLEIKLQAHISNLIKT